LYKHADAVHISVELSPTTTLPWFAAILATMWERPTRAYGYQTTFGRTFKKMISGLAAVVIDKNLSEVSY
jgi:hypothetical protein